ncbi:MAG: type II toxin-antitoxin system VapC family toxin [Acidobacteria bacterium]|nr:type II toxin-antitoxin system VapC family toxin [Acidobacteriota bacterium]
MNLLLDTHTFIWWADAPEKLSDTARQALEDEHNRLLLSLVSIWEIQIKVQLGKMKLHLPLKDLVESQEQANDLAILSVTKEHIFALDHLPFHHKDPFDRLLIAQGVIEKTAIVSADTKLSIYAVNLIW